MRPPGPLAPMLYAALAAAALLLVYLLLASRRAPAPRPEPEEPPPFVDLDGAAAAALVASTPELIVLDVRTPLEFAGGHLPHARSLPLDRLEAELGSLPREAPFLVYCAMGGRSSAAAALLASRGFRKVHNLEAGIHSYPQGR
jgi:rhodanese-related sulfurtransferase